MHTFLTKQKYQLYLMLGNFVLLFILMYFSGRRIKKGLKIFFEQEKKEFPRLPNKSISLMVASIETLIVTKIFMPNIILLLSQTSLGETDPVFGLDIFVDDVSFELLPVVLVVPSVDPSVVPPDVFPCVGLFALAILKFVWA